jgi:HK97 family phage prohead protease
MPMTFSRRPQQNGTRVLQERLDSLRRVKLLRRSARSFGATAAPAVSGSKIRGLCVPYNSLSNQMRDFDGVFREKYARGCFARSLSDPDLRVCVGHDDLLVLGTNGMGTARFWEEDSGLWCEADAPSTQWVSDLLTSMRRGDIAKMSAAFYMTSQSWSNEGGQRIRTVQSGTLIEASVVTFPAYRDTEANVQDFEQDNVDEDELDENLLWAASAANHQPLGELALRSARRRREGGVLTLAAAQADLDALEEKVDPLRKYHREIAALRAIKY